MKNKIIAILLCLLLLTPLAGTAYADSSVYTVAEVENLCDGIVAYKGYGNAQSWINGELTDTAGSIAEFYIIALSQQGDYDFSSYERALLSYLGTHEVYSAASREKYALALAAAGSTDRYISDTADEAIGGLGLMSLVFGLHLLNNGYDSALYSTDGLVSEILGEQFSDGGWAVMGSYGDVDVTAMTLQALAPHYGRRGDVTNAVNAALDFLSDRQTESGGFKSMGVENCESAAQVLTALSDLGVDAQADARFIKNGNTVLNGMLTYYNGDGSFSHTGGGFNESATVQAFYAMTAYLRMCRGQGPLYVLDHADHSAPSSGGGTNDSGGYTGGDTADQPQQNGGQTNISVGDASSSYSPNAPVPAGKASEATAAPTEVPAETVASSAPATQTASEPAPQISFQPTVYTVSTATADENGSGGGYKLYAVIGILLLSGAACGVLFLLKKRGKKHYITVAVLAGAALIFVLLTNFQSAESYRKSADDGGDLSVVMSIRCDTIKDREKVNDYIPDDGVILDETTFSISEGDTVYDVLLNASMTRGVAVDNRGAQGAAYIAGINFLYEFDYGALSGWMYRVNGKFPDVGCQSYTLSDGDRIEWLYTTDIGHDLD